MKNLRSFLILLALSTFPAIICAQLVRLESFPSGLPGENTVIGDKIYFSDDDGISGRELWTWNGSTMKLEADINPGIGSSLLFEEEFVEYAGKVYFTAYGDSSGFELWSWDGAVAKLEADINPDTASSWPSSLTVYNNILYFAANDGISGKELWSWDGNTAVLVGDINPLSNNSNPNGLIVFQNKLFFSASDNNTGIELWSWDNDTLSLAADINPGQSSSNPANPLIFNGALYFDARVAPNPNTSVYKFDGTSVTKVNSLRRTYYNYNVVLDGKIYSSDISGSNIYAFNDTSLTLVFNVATEFTKIGWSVTGGIRAYPVIAFDNKVYIVAIGGTLYGNTVWTIDSDTTLLIWSSVPNLGGTGAANFTIFNNILHCNGQNNHTHPGAGYGLWAFCTDLLDVSICQGDSVLIFGHYRNTEGIYFDSTTLECQKLHVIPTTYTNLPTLRICKGDSTLIFGNYQSTSGFYSDTILSSLGCDSILFQNIIVDSSIIYCPIQLSLKLFLSGPYDRGTSFMHDSLRTKGLIPLTEPYSAQFTHYFPGGGETIDTSMLLVADSNAIVDWVFIELRDKTDTSVVATRSALLQRDGDVVDVDGVSPVSFEGTSPDDYFIAVRHRNHLGVMTATTYTLSTSSSLIDFTTIPTFGTNAMQELSGVHALWSGNALPDQYIKFSGPNNDRDAILIKIGGVIPTNTVAGYFSEDVNMDGLVKFSGPNNDVDVILYNIGGSVPTNVVVEQLP